MSRLFWRASLGVGAVSLAVALTATPAPAGVGTRLINGDGDTAGRCLSIANAGRSSTVLMEPCNTNAHQGWVLVNDTWNGGVRITSQDADARGRCLTANGAGGGPVTMDACDTNNRQQSWLDVDSSGWMQLVELETNSPQCLDVRDWGQSNIVQTWQCRDTERGNQMWKFW